MNFTNGLEQITEVIKKCIYRENKPDGLLDDVETIIPIYANEEGVDEPCIWITQHPTLPADEKRNINEKVKLVTPFQFTCVEYDPDPEIAELKGQNLATRVGHAVQKNYLKISKELGYPRVISHIDIKSYLPNGDVAVKGKSDKVPCTALVLDVVFYIDWKNCCKKQ